MSGRNGSEGDIELTLPTAITLPSSTVVAKDTTIALTLDPESDPSWKPGTPYRIESALSSAAQDAPFASKLSARLQTGFGRGIGLDYNVAYGMYTRDGYAIAAGAATGIQLVGTGLTHSTASPIVAFAEFLGSLYVAQRGIGGTNGGRVMKITGGTGTAAEVFSLAAGDLIQDLIVADNGSGTTTLYASSESSTHTNARLHASVDGSSWTHTVAGTDFVAGRGLGRMAYEFMQPSGSNGDWRIVAITGAKTFAYTLPNVDPMIGTASWSADVRIGTGGSLHEIAAARRHFWFGADDNLYDVDELAQSTGLTSFMRTQQQTGNGQAVLYFNGYVYLAVGRGLIRVPVSQQGLLNEVPGQCAPGWKTPAENTVRGYVTALCPDQGGILAAIYNPTLTESYVCWGVDRNIVGIDSPNPLIWHGPEVYFAADYKVTRMLTSGLAGDLRLWLASQSVGGTARLDWVSMPISGSPVQDLISGGGMAFCNGNPAGLVVQPIVRMELLRDGWDDGGTDLHILDQDTVVSRGLSKVLNTTTGAYDDDGIGTKMTLYSRADPAPGSTTWTSTGDVTNSPFQDVTQASVVQGRKTQLRIDMFNPNGASSPAKVGVLESVRRLGWSEARSVRTVRLPIKYGDGVAPNQGWDPDDITFILKALTEGAKTTFRDYWDRRWTLKLDQVLSTSEEVNTGGEWGKTVHATLQGSLVAAL